MYEGVEVWVAGVVAGAAASGSAFGVGEAWLIAVLRLSVKNNRAASLSDRDVFVSHNGG